MRISALSLTDCWSFGAGADRIPFGTRTAIVGPNNAGKSNLLRAFRLAQRAMSGGTNPTEVDAPPQVAHQSAAREPKPSMRVSMALDAADISQLVDALQLAGNQPRAGEVLQQILELGLDLTLTAVNESRFAAGLSTPAFPTVYAARESIADPTRDHVLQLWQSRGLGECARLLKDWAQRIVYFSAFREISTPSSLGNAMRSHLHQWHGPTTVAHPERHKFREIERRFCYLSGMTNAHLRVSHDGSQLIVEANERYLDIERLGDGLKQLLRFAFESVIRPQSLFLIEEPELHLHPGTQRRLAYALQEYAVHQLIVSTHSPVFLDGGLTDTILLVDHNDTESVVTPCTQFTQLRKTLDLLDVRASDLLQAVVAVWVEGPSDRHFLKRCLWLSAPELQEGIHYQFVYYGGSLRKHISFDDDSDLPKLLRLARHALFVADRDTASESLPIAAQVSRLANECEKSGGVAWITAGREIENYLGQDLLQRTLSDLGGLSSLSVALDPFDDLNAVLARLRSLHPDCHARWIWSYDDNKVRMMHEFSARLQIGDLDQLDLRKQLTRAVQYIRTANGLPLG